jgi:adenosine deaminase
MLYDSHLHLSGSVSHALLERMAHKKDKMDIFNKFIANVALIEKLKEDLEAGKDVNSDIIKLIFGQFNLIYEIITFNDYLECIDDIVENTLAAHLEIRTTPKLADGSINNDSVGCFLAGLRKHKGGSKKVRGILSLDRTKYNLNLGRKIVDIVAKHEELVGIDISGNPDAPRTLSGEPLGELINYALDKEIGVTIHMGESKSQVEVDDINIILTTLERRRAENKSISKVRFGHCIYLTPEQKERIRKLGIPIEIAPTCHRMLGWWKQDKPHPAADIYPKEPMMFLSGTDDITLFNSSIKNEAELVAEMVGSSELLSKHDEQISRFGFF